MSVTQFERLFNKVTMDFGNGTSGVILSPEMQISYTKGAATLDLFSEEHALRYALIITDIQGRPSDEPKEVAEWLRDSFFFNQDDDISAVTEWGGITGTIPSQTDLQDALDLKVDSVNGKTGVVVLNGTDIALLEGTTVPTVTGAFASLSTEQTVQDQAIGQNAVDIIAHSSLINNPHQTSTGNLINSDTVEFPSSLTQADINVDIKGNVDDLFVSLDSKVDSVIGGSDITVDNTDPRNPIINYAASDPVDYVIVGDNVSLLANDAGYLTSVTSTYGELYQGLAGNQKLKNQDEVILFNEVGPSNGATPAIAGSKITVPSDGDYNIQYQGSVISKRDQMYSFWIGINGITLDELGCAETTEDNMCHSFSYGRIISLTAGDEVTIVGQCSSSTDKDWKLQSGARFFLTKL